VCDGDTGLDSKFVGLAGFAFAYALNFWRVQCVQLVFVVALLGAYAFGSL
jgi:hypothetical protein